MPTTLSNEIKVSLYAGNLGDVSGLLRKEDCTTVVQYGYDGIRNRDSKGFPIGISKPLYLDLTLRNFSHKISKHFLQEIHKNTPYDYTLLYNAKYDDNKILQGYDGSLLARGYVVDIEELYDNQESEKSETNQKLMKLRLLLTRLEFKGMHNHSILTISND